MCSAFRIVVALILLTLIAPHPAQANGYLSPDLVKESGRHELYV
jgi:hypothetical protein